jgi:hypothetical protein
MKTRFPNDNRRPLPLTAEQVREAKECKEPLILRTLLAESLRRLRAGRQVEKDHGVIHPEMTCIIRDCERLAARLNGKNAPAADVPENGGDDDLRKMFQ